MSSATVRIEVLRTHNRLENGHISVPYLAGARPLVTEEAAEAAEREGWGKRVTAARGGTSPPNPLSLTGEGVQPAEPVRAEGAKARRRR